MADLQAWVDALWARAGVGAAGRLRSEDTREEAHWHVEASGGLYRFVQWERGRTEPLTKWLGLSDAVHWILAGLAAAKAQAEELRR